jgi:hypothetical protein
MNLLWEMLQEFTLRTAVTFGVILTLFLFMLAGAMIGGEIGVYCGAIIGACFIVTVLNNLL